MSAPFVTTTRLSNVIQMINVSRQSGILRIVRVSGDTREVGQIRFAQGEPVAALLGPLVGPTALNVLSSWGECSYAFDESDPDGPTVDLSTLIAESGSSATAEMAAGSWPTYYYPGAHSGPGAQASIPPNPAAMFGSLPSLDSPSVSYPTPGTVPSVMPYNSPASQSSPPNPWATSLPPRGPAQSAPRTPSSTLPTLGRGTPLPVQVLAAIPSRTPVAEHPEQLPLGRVERMVLLLVDGKRSIGELVRLTRRTDWEVYNVVHHLQLLELVEITSA